MLTNGIAEYYASWQNMDVDFVRNNWDKKLYHYIQYGHFISLLQNSALYFVNIFDSWWDEPYELFYFRPRYVKKINNEPIDAHDLSMRFYAQCWGLNDDSDAMWKIYTGPNRDGVRIQTTLGEIMQLLYPVKNVNEFAPFVGFMNYMSQDDIRSWVDAHSDVKFIDWRDCVKDSLFMKRDNFSTEKEFRVLLSVPTEVNNHYNPWKDYISVPININSFIKEIVLSPFTDDATLKNQIAEIRKYVNGNMVIRQSNLYKDDLSSKTILIR